MGVLVQAGSLPPENFYIAELHGLVDELVVEDDPEYDWQAFVFLYSKFFEKILHIANCPPYSEYGPLYGDVNLCFTMYGL